MIKDLNIVADFDYDSHDTHGVVTQYNTGKIQDCKVTGTVTGHMGSTSSMSHPAFGGIVGENEVAGTIRSRYFHIYDSYRQLCWWYRRSKHWYY